MPQASTDLAAATSRAAHPRDPQTGPHPDPITPRRAMNAVFLACGCTMGLWATQIARIKMGFGLSDPALSTVVLAFACGSIPTMPLSGSLVTRWGAVPSIRFACILSAIGLVLLGIAPTYTALLLASFLAGGAIGALDVAMNAQANDLASLWRRPILSSIHGWFSLGGLVGAVAGGALTGLGATVAVVLSAGGVGLFVTGLVTSRHLHLPIPVSHADGPSFAWPSRGVLGIGVLCLFAFLIEGGIGDWVTVYLHETAGASLDWAASGFAGFSVAMAIGRFTGDAVVQRFGSRGVIIASGLLAAAGIGLAVVVPLPAAATVGFLLAGFGMANVVPLLFQAAGNVPGVPSAVGVAMVATMGYGAFLMGPPLIGFIAGAISLQLSLLVLVACALAISVGGRWR